MDINSQDREQEIQLLCQQVLETSTLFTDPCNGPYTSQCPFCGVERYGHSGQMSYSMNEIEHNLDCAYLIAKDLATGGGESGLTPQ